MRYKRDGSATGSERSITAWMSVKMAVVPPIPSARVTTAAAVKTGAWRSWRMAYRIAPNGFGMVSLLTYYDRTPRQSSGVTERSK
jgi:hypothetical protein